MIPAELKEGFLYPKEELFLPFFSEQYFGLMLL